MANQLDRIKVLSAGIISLILMLGIARFSYTPMLPLMQAQAGLGLLPPSATCISKTNSIAQAWLSL